MTKDELKKRLGQLKHEINEIRKELDELEDGTMCLKVSDFGETLNIHVKNSKYYIGRISKEGKCHILTDFQHESWEYWKERGMKVDNTRVEWKGKRYFITKDSCILKNNHSQEIYDFLKCIPLKSDDENIQRFSNGRTKIY